MLLALLCTLLPDVNKTGFLNLAGFVVPKRIASWVLTPNAIHQVSMRFPIANKYTCTFSFRQDTINRSTSEDLL